MNPTQARKILGMKAKQFTDADIENLISKFEYLAEALLDTYEKGLFQGKTLKQLLQNE